MILTQQQHLILKGKVCPYCKAKTEYLDSSCIYGKSYGMAYVCIKCDAYVGVHAGTNKALGRLANKELRYWKKEAHKYFDQLGRYKNSPMSRTQSYQWLSGQLNLPKKYTHIGMFGVETCKKVVEVSKNFFIELKIIKNLSL
jgi:hypothetical protein